MIRQKFIQRIAGGLGAAATTTGAVRTTTVTYRIEGFTCVACAVGLDTLLKDRNGVVQSKSSYPDRQRSSSTVRI